MFESTFLIYMAGQFATYGFGVLFFVFQNIILTCKLWESKFKTRSLSHNDSSLYGNFQHQMSNFPYLIQNFLSRRMHFYHAHPSYAHEHFRCHPCIGSSLSQTLMSDIYANVQSLPYGQSQQTPQLNHKTQPDAKQRLLFVACLMCVTLLILILLCADLEAHDKMFAQICILLKFWARTKFEAQSK